jgi:hypothetical protein
MTRASVCHQKDISGIMAPALPIQVSGKGLARASVRWRVQGVTYGPFAPNANAEPFPEAPRVRKDLATARSIGINAIRTYHTPPEWLLRLAEEQELAVVVDVPWPRHLCCASSPRLRKQARIAIHQAATSCRAHPCVMALSIGNEVPPDIVRFQGARQTERFLAELADEARQVVPDRLITYANFPPTEYLDLGFLDFVTFNVYLHDREAFRRYLFRLQSLAGERPLVLGELGMDSFQHGEEAQARFLGGHLEEALLTGLAGAFVFSWTDEWFTGGAAVGDWAFGLVSADRAPKQSFHTVRELYGRPLAALLPRAPRVSVVVCTYNGGRTLEECLRSLGRLHYPDYEVIVVDDGSTDDTPAILARFPSVRSIRQENQGLSAARNIGLQHATGPIIAYTDSDCFADPDWLTQLVYQLEKSGAAAIGGPNLTPPDGRLAACVAASPGQPTHVLESDQVAEHVPGCNMALRRDALLAVNGFDPRFRQAGDDVDLCWRLQEAGHWITFAPGAVVWHHRRQSAGAYLRQQAGYGVAEGLLMHKHPNRFNSRGSGKWRGILYGTALQGMRLGRPIIYRGTFGTGLFQSLYRPAPAHWATLPGTLEWHLGALLVAAAALVWPVAWVGTAVMLLLSLAVASLQAAQAQLPPQHDRPLSRLIIVGLCYLQPLVRSWSRYRVRLFADSSGPQAVPPEARGRPLPLTGARTVAYWSEDGCERTTLLGRLVTCLTASRCGMAIDTGWASWDLEIYCHPWTAVQLCTMQEEHGRDRHLIRVRYSLRLSGTTTLLATMALLAAGWLALVHWGLGVACASLVLLLLGLLWWRGACRASYAVGIVDAMARELNLLLLPDEQARRSATPQAGDEDGPPQGNKHG